MRLPAPGDTLLHPVALGVIVLLAVNDHVLKEAWPGLVTGKVSDVAGLVVLPLVLVALREWSSDGRVASRRAVLGVTAAVGLAFTLVQLTPVGASAYEVGMGLARWPLDAVLALGSGHEIDGPRTVRLWQDATDLLALPALAVSLWLHRRRLAVPRRTQPAPAVSPTVHVSS